MNKVRSWQNIKQILRKLNKSRRVYIFNWGGAGSWKTKVRKLDSIKWIYWKCLVSILFMPSFSERDVERGRRRCSHPFITRGIYYIFLSKFSPRIFAFHALLSEILCRDPTFALKCSCIQYGVLLLIKDMMELLLKFYFRDWTRKALCYIFWKLK